ncbi:MAG TPA: hypothetical protein VF574_11510 [Allosphingosinicella sp.]|jgi:hypothetical protein
MAYDRLEAESVRQRLEAQRRLSENLEPTGEIALEFERVMKLLARYDRRDGRLGAREIGPGQEQVSSRARIPSPLRGEGQVREANQGEGATYGRDAEAGPHPPAASRLPPSPLQGEGFIRIVIGLDPPASSHGDSCGIVVCARDEDGLVSVIADLTQSGLSPEAWARRVVDAADLYGATKVVAEKNQGGEMIASVLRAVDANLPVRLVHAGASKATRAEPIALRFETGRARLAGHFPDLEDQLCALTWSGYQGPGSPDRADAMVWAMTELFEKERPAPSVRRL